MRILFYYKTLVLLKNTKITTMLDSLGNSDSQYSRVTSILFRKQLDIEIIYVHKSNDGRILLLNLLFEENNFSIMNIYVPNSPAERKSFFMKINNWVKKTLT